jgi:glycosyltransferase involved in cell wall biosynthesis
MVFLTGQHFNQRVFKQNNLTMKNVLFVIIQPFDPTSGGVERSTFRIGSALISLGYFVSVFSFRKTNNGFTDFGDFSVINSKEEGVHKNKKNINQLSQVIHQNNPDYIINQMPYESEINIILQKLQSSCNYALIACLRQTLFSVKDNIDKYISFALPNSIAPFFKNPLGRKVFQIIHKYKHARSLKFILDIYDKFVFYAEPNYAEVEYFIGKYKREKIATIPNSIENICEIVPEKKKKVLWLGRLVYKQKRAELILPLWKKIMHALPDWSLEIVGEGSAFEDLKITIESENIPRVKLYGKQVPDKYYEEASVFILTSAYEGFGNTVIEAQSYAAIPFIFDTYAVGRWILENNKNGFLIPPFNIDLMAKGIIEFARMDSGEKYQLQKNALENTKRFHISKIGKMWDELLINLSQERSKKTIDER